MVDCNLILSFKNSYLKKKLSMISMKIIYRHLYYCRSCRYEFYKTALKLKNFKEKYLNILIPKVEEFTGKDIGNKSLEEGLKLLEDEKKYRKDYFTRCAVTKDYQTLLKVKVFEDILSSFDLKDNVDNPFFNFLLLKACQKIDFLECCYYKSGNDIFTEED